MSSNDQSNKLIKWSVILLDFIVMNALIAAFARWHPSVMTWAAERRDIFFLACNLAMMVSEYRFYTVIHRRIVVSSDILRRIMGLTMLHALVAYVTLKVMDYSLPVGAILVELDTLLFVLLLLAVFLRVDRRFTGVCVRAWKGLTEPRFLPPYALKTIGSVCISATGVASM